MSLIESLPLDLHCRCGHHLLAAIVSIGMEGEKTSQDLIVRLVDVICPTCRIRCRNAEDDYTRAVMFLTGEFDNG